MHTCTASEISDQNKAVVHITCSANYKFAASYVKSFNERICSSILSLLCRLEMSDNLLFVNYFHSLIY